MIERNKENLSRTRNEEITEKQREVRLRNRIHVRNNSSVFTNINSIRETRNYQNVSGRYVKKEINKTE